MKTQENLIIRDKKDLEKKFENSQIRDNEDSGQRAFVDGDIHVGNSQSIQYQIIIYIEKTCHIYTQQKVKAL